MQRNFLLQILFGLALNAAATAAQAGQLVREFSGERSTWRQKVEQLTAEEAKLSTPKAQGPLDQGSLD